MSVLCRSVSETALRCLGEVGSSVHAPALVYCTRHGELDLISGLLESLAAKEPLSPAAFANSVDHAAAGYFGIAAGNRRCSRTLLAGEDSFACGFLDALCLLAEGTEKEVLLVCADAPAPEPFLRKSGGWPAYSLALLLHPVEDGRAGLRFRREGVGGEPAPSGLPQALAFLRWHLSQERELRLLGPGGEWRWDR